MKVKTCDTREVDIYEASPECAYCGGSCCKFMGCHYAPNDFSDLSFEGLKTEIEKGFISIDWWDAPNPQYYLRARHLGAPIVDGSWGGRCVHLKEDGCYLSFGERPAGGKAVKPRNEPFGDCLSSYSKEDCKNDWLKYGDILSRLALYFRVLDNGGDYE